MPGFSIRGAWPHETIRANGSSLSLVLIERIAHVRGPVPGLSIRANGSSLPLVLIERIAHVRGGGRAVASVKFFDETFLQKSFDLALALTGRQPGKKLGKQRSAFPGRRSASSVNSRRVTARDNSRPWQLASLVLIEKIAHVRGGGCKGAAGTLPPPLTNATERDTIEIEKESLPVRRLAQFMYYLRSSRNPWTGAATFSCF